MSDIQTDLAERAQFTAISANRCEFFWHLARRQPAERHFENGKFTPWQTKFAHLFLARFPVVFLYETH
jgi:hypothetical protein